MKVYAGRWAIAAWIGLGPHSAWADDPLGRAANGVTFDQFVQNTMADYAVPGAVVVVANAVGTVFLKGYGVREKGKSAVIDPDTRFQIASMSKLVAATAVGALVDRGVVSWDVPVREFSPGTELAVPYATANATLRDYFAHRTGLPAYTGDLLATLGLSTDELVRRARFLPFDHSFRAQFAYSNYGIFLGQQSAARAAGMTPPQLISDSILRPLGMARSGPTRAELFKDDNRAAAHDQDGAVMPYEDVDAFSGAGALVSTGADIARWMRMLLAAGQFEGRQMLSKATVSQVFSASMVEGPGGPLRDPNAAAGLGCDSYWFLRERVIEKNGALNGVRTIVTLIPGLDVGIAVFANRQLTVFPEAVRAEFLERQIGPSGRDLQARIRDEQKLWSALLDIPKPPADAQPMAHDPAAYAGSYESPFYGALQVSRSADVLGATIGGYPARLTHWSGDTFLLSFANPDIAPGLLSFAFAADKPQAQGIDGRRIPQTLTVDYGHFTRVP